MKNKNYLFIPLLLLSCLHWQLSQAQEENALKDTTWTKKGLLNINFANVGLSNWVGGGQNAISLSTIFSYAATRKTNKYSWRNNINFGYGIVKQEGFDEIRKTDDQLVVSTQYDRIFKNKKWSATALLDLKTQFTTGFEYAEDPLKPGEEIANKISQFLAPGYLIFSTGVSYNTDSKNKKTKFAATLSGTTLKSTFVLDENLSDQGFYGVEAGEKVRIELGANFTSLFTTVLMENVDFRTTLNLFSNYENLAVIDINWEVLLAMKINKYLNASFATNLIYDQDTGFIETSITQFKHTLNIGFGLAF